jgi:hypothetical protein
VRLRERENGEISHIVYAFHACFYTAFFQQTCSTWIQRIRMKTVYLSLLFLAALVACSGSGASDAAVSSRSNNSSASQANTPIIDNEDLTPGLKGVDANNNGIRDDIDRLIAQKYSATPALKKAAEQQARALQKFMEATTRQQALIDGDEDSRATWCLSKQFPSTSDDAKFKQVTAELEALTANTQERFTKYWESNNLVGGAVFKESQEPVCD